MIVFSGIQPTGKLHIGNWLGAIRQWVLLQNAPDAKCYFSIVDLHALTVPHSPIKFKQTVIETAVDLLALGIDPKKSVFFIQSRVPEHTELAWILATVSGIGDLERMTQFKEKSLKHKRDVNAGLLTYPILQAADILLYDADTIPIGEDQKQHIEFARELARRFNARFGDTFKLPKAAIANDGARVMSIKNPVKKMSKTEPFGCIFLSDGPEVIRDKMKRAVTDSGSDVKYAPDAKPGISNLLEILSLVEGTSIGDLETEFKGKGYAEFKERFAAVLSDKLADFRDRRRALLEDLSGVWNTLEAAALSARAVASKKMRDVRGKVGILY